MTHREFDGNNYWAGLWGPITREYLSEVFIDDTKMTSSEFKQNKKQIEDTLKSEGYDPQVKVSKYSSLESRGGGKRYLKDSKIAIPVCWLSGNDTEYGVTFQRTRKNVLKASENTVKGKMRQIVCGNSLQQLDKNKTLPII